MSGLVITLIVYKLHSIVDSNLIKLRYQSKSSLENSYLILRCDRSLSSLYNSHKNRQDQFCWEVGIESKSLLPSIYSTQVTH
jgi:hypothetical protein